MMEKGRREKEAWALVARLEEHARTARENDKEVIAQQFIEIASLVTLFIGATITN